MNMTAGIGVNIQEDSHMLRLTSRVPVLNRELGFDFRSDDS